jgi:hypothetical protein
MSRLGHADWVPTRDSWLSEVEREVRTPGTAVRQRLASEGQGSLYRSAIQRSTWIALLNAASSSLPPK